MPKIGVVLSGCASKGAYEIGCLSAIDDFFGPGAITSVSSSSIGAMIGHLYGMGRKAGLETAYGGRGAQRHQRYEQEIFQGPLHKGEGQGKVICNPSGRRGCFVPKGVV